LTSLHSACQERLRYLVISQSGYTVLELLFEPWTLRLWSQKTTHRTMSICYWGGSLTCPYQSINQSTIQSIQSNEVFYRPLTIFQVHIFFLWGFRACGYQ
jgi:hypothetical protein